jgi:hypothetical protein
MYVCIQMLVFLVFYEKIYLVDYEFIKLLYVLCMIHEYLRICHIVLY